MGFYYLKSTINHFNNDFSSTDVVFLWFAMHTVIIYIVDWYFFLLEYILYDTYNLFSDSSHMQGQETHCCVFLLLLIQKLL
jgi:hypothetical protein